MDKYSALMTSVFSVFDQAGWKSENIKTFPSDYVAIDAGNEFLRVTIIPSGQALNRLSVSGILMIDVFTAAGNGPKRAMLLADKLDTYLQNKTIAATGGNVQFGESAVRPLGKDTANPSLTRHSYTIPFNLFRSF